MIGSARRALGTFAAHELRIQARSLRFRAVAGIWVGAALVPALSVFLRRDRAAAVNGLTYLIETLPFALPLTAAACFVIAADGLLREREEESWSTLSLCGMDTLSYVLCRWLAILPPLLMASTLPLMGAAAFALAAGQRVPWWAGAALWTLWVAPMVLLWSALGFGFGTTAGGLFGGAGLLAVSAMTLLGILDAILFRFHLHVGGPTPWVGELLRSLRLLQEALRETASLRAVPFPLPASQAPLDFRTQAQQALAPLATTAALAALGVGWAIVAVRRTRPDLQPWRLGEGHPLRSFVAVAGRLRGRFAPDAAIAPRDRLALLASLLGALLALGVAVERDARFVRRAEARFALETSSWPPPTDRSLRVLACALDGRLDADGSVRVVSRVELRNESERAQEHLSMELGEGVRLLALEAAGKAVRWRRRGERLAVRLEPPLAPGKGALLRAVVSGRPARTVLALPGFDEHGGYLSFQRSYGRYRWARFARELPDLAASFTARAISPTRVRLAARDLMPVVRNTPHELVGAETWDGARLRREEVLVPARLSLALATPPGVWLADACGDVTSRGRLAGSCTLPPPALTVRGGTQRPVRAGAVTVALLPGHEELALAKLGPLDQLGEMVHEVWPDEDLLASTVLLEVPDEATFLAEGQRVALFRHFAFGIDAASVVTEGHLLIVPEVGLVAGPPLAPGALAARLVGSRLLARRQVVAAQQPLFAALVESLAARRAGLGPPEGAVLPAVVQGPAVYQVSLLKLDADADPAAWERRLSALLIDLGHRIGDEAVRRGLAAFLSRANAPPGTLAELVEEWERASGASLDDYYHDYLAGTALPLLDLADVTFAAAADGWAVRGRVVNSGTGEARCEVALLSEASRRVVEVVVPSAGAAPFSFATSSAPRAVVLDPDGRCHRYRPLVPVPVERIDYRGVMRG
jgi:hypothetical protein